MHPVLILLLGMGASTWPPPSARAMVGSWMNDSGFWVFARMGGLTEVEALKTYTPLLALGGLVAMLTTLVMALLLLPLR